MRWSLGLPGSSEAGNSLTCTSHSRWSRQERRSVEELLLHWVFTLRKLHVHTLYGHRSMHTHTPALHVSVHRRQVMVWRAAVFYSATVCTATGEREVQTTQDGGGRKRFRGSTYIYTSTYTLGCPHVLSMCPRHACWCACVITPAVIYVRQGGGGIHGKVRARDSRVCVRVAGAETAWVCFGSELGAGESEGRGLLPMSGEGLREEKGRGLQAQGPPNG